MWDRDDVVLSVLLDDEEFVLMLVGLTGGVFKSGELDEEEGELGGVS
jgi:hypothetical protein